MLVASRKAQYVIGLNHLLAVTHLLWEHKP